MLRVAEAHETNAFLGTLKFKPKKWLFAGLTQLAMTVKDLTIIGPVAQLVFTLTAESYVRGNFFGKTNNLSVRAQLRLAEMEKRIQTIAKRAGVVDYHRFRAIAGPAACSFGALGNSTLVIPAQCLLKPEDLPADLSLDQLDRETREEWTDGCMRFLNQSFAQEELSPDRRDWYLLHLFFKNPEAFEKIDDALAAHEIGHCVLGHTEKRAWIRFGWRLLAIPTLAISTLFEERVMQNLSLSYEEEADLFSATKASGAAGLFTYFSIMLFIGQVYHQTKIKGFDVSGNYTKDHSHPLLTTRVDYLAKLAGATDSAYEHARLFLQSCQ